MTKGKLCLVTGANAGIGKTTSLGLVKMGTSMVMVSRSQERGEATNALYPGIVPANFGRETTSWFFAMMFRLMSPFLAASPEVEGLTGR